MQPRSQPPNPNVAAIRTGIAKMLLALILLSQPEIGVALRKDISATEGWWEHVKLGFAVGFGGDRGWNTARELHKLAASCLCPRRPREGFPGQPGHASGATLVPQLDSQDAAPPSGQVSGATLLQRLDSPQDTALPSCQVSGATLVQRLDSLSPQDAALPSG